MDFDFDRGRGLFVHVPEAKGNYGRAGPEVLIGPNGSAFLPEAPVEAPAAPSAASPGAAPAGD